MFGNLKENFAELQQDTKDLIQNNIEYYKLWTFKVIASSATSLLKIFLLAITLVMVLVFFSIAGALALGYYVGNYALGFLIVGGIYALLSLVIYYFRYIIEKPIITKLSDIFYNDED